MKVKIKIHIKRLYIIIALLLWGTGWYPSSLLAQYMAEKIQDQGDDANRMVWVIMGDGYTSLEMDDFHQDIDRIIDEFFKTSPWNEYKEFINIYRIDVISNESGADHPSYDIYVDTVFDATYDTYGISRLLTVNDASALEIASSVPSFDAVMVLVNDETYGGSGGTTIVFSDHESAGRIALHEAGHLLGDLADEYETPYPGYPEGDSEPNVTYQTEREYIPWIEWIEADTPLPTPNSGDSYGVGLYEGARYLSTGIYRPDHNCLMRSLGVPYCPICAEALVVNLHNYVDPIDRYLPDEENVFLSSDSGLSQFKIELVNSASTEMAINWEVDGVIKEGEYGTTFTVDESRITQGKHNVKVLVSDYTSLVRNDPQDLLLSSRSWYIEKESASGVISGKVVNEVTNRGIADVVVASEGGYYSTTTGVDGSYHLSPVEEGFYTISASGTIYSTDTKTDIEVIDGEITAVNFSLSPLYSMYSISGQIRGDVKEGMTVDLKKGDETYLSSKTDSEGNYSFKGVETGSYTVVPNLSTYLFTPLNYTLSIEDKDITNINFDVLLETCPATVALKDQPGFLLASLRELQSTVFAKSELGRKYTSLYYRHAPEIAGHIIGHDEIREGALELILRIMPDITSLLAGEKIRMGSELVEEVEDFLDNLENYASPELKTITNMVKKDMGNDTVLYKLGVMSQ